MGCNLGKLSTPFKVDEAVTYGYVFLQLVRLAKGRKVEDTATMLVVFGVLAIGAAVLLKRAEEGHDDRDEKEEEL